MYVYAFNIFRKDYIKNISYLRYTYIHTCNRYQIKHVACGTHQSPVCNRRLTPSTGENVHV